jgi:flagellar basal body-associated protein FliL
MAETNSRQRVMIILQLVFLVLVCGGIVAVAFSFGVFNPPKDYRSLTLKVENSAGNVQLIFSIPGDTSANPVQVSTPWEKTISLKRGSEVYVTAANPAQYGDLKCTILLDGKNWKKETATYPKDKVYCAGIVP